MVHTSLGDDVVSKLLYVRAASFEYGDLHAAVVIKMHVQRRLREVVTLVVIAREAFRQFTLLVFIEVDERGNAGPRAVDLHCGLLQARADEITYSLRAVSGTARGNVLIELGGSSSSTVMVTRCIALSPMWRRDVITARAFLRHFSPAVSGRGRLHALNFSRQANLV